MDYWYYLIDNGAGCYLHSARREHPHYQCKDCNPTNVGSMKKKVTDSLFKSARRIAVLLPPLRKWLENNLVLILWEDCPKMKAKRYEPVNNPTSPQGN